MNHVILYGRITKDPELRQTKSDRAIALFTIATDEGRDKNDNRVSEFHDCVAWNQTAETIGKYFKKGDPILVHGRLTHRSYEHEGRKVYVSEVVVDRFEFTAGRKEPYGTEPAPADGYKELDDDGELPF